VVLDALARQVKHQQRVVVRDEACKHLAAHGTEIDAAESILQRCLVFLELHEHKGEFAL